MTNKSLPGAPKQQTAAHRQNDTAQPRLSTNDRPTQAEWIAAVPGLRRVGNEYHGACPNCGGDDRFRVLDDGAAFCRQCSPTGAEFPTLLHAANLNGSAAKVRILPTGSGADKFTKFEIRDVAGTPVAVHMRFDKPNGTKDMPWRLPDGTGGLGGMKVPDLPLYRSQFIPDTKATAICIVEGERKADVLAAAEPSLLVLGTVTGADKTPAPVVLQPVIDTGLPIYLWPDNDDPGIKHMERIGKLLAYDVKVIDWKSAPPKGDAADWALTTDRPSWERLAAAAVAPGVTVEGTDGRAVHLTAADAALMNGESAAAAAPGERKKSTQHGAYGAARAMVDLSERTMFVAGRGWFHRGSESTLWKLDTARVMLSKVQAHPARRNCAKGLRSTAIMGELEGMLDVDGDLLDADDWLAGLPDGAGLLDLRTGAVRPATIDDRITMTLGAVPDEGEPELWLKVIRETFAACADPSAIVEYVRGWFRMALTGDCSQEAMLFLFGPPGTGKSIVADTLLHIAGGYGVTVAAEHLVGDPHHHRAWLARLDRRRLIRVVEVPSRGAWNTSEVLPLVSGESITANRMRQDPFDFRSRAHLLCTGNHQPYASSGSGLWRRFRPVDCRNVPAAPDETLRVQLRAEYGRILAWAIAAPVKLPQAPDEMKAGAEYARNERDPIGAWLDEHYTFDPAGVTWYADLYGAYCEDLPEDKRPSNQLFGTKLTERYGHPVTAWMNGKTVKVRHCTRLAQE